MRRLLLLVAAVLVLGSAFAAEYGDVQFERKAAGMDDVPPAYFPHWVHRMSYKCGACHEELFKAKAGANPITMEAIQSGTSCGTCHNGKIAFASNFDTCQRCHFK